MKKSFTLVEVLIVVVIIGVLTSFSVPAFNRAKRKAENKEAITIGKVMVEEIKMRTVEGSNVQECGRELTACSIAFSNPMLDDEKWMSMVRVMAGPDFITGHFYVLNRKDVRKYYIRYDLKNSRKLLEKMIETDEWS